MGTFKVNGNISSSGTISAGNGQIVMGTSGSLATYLTTTGGWARGWSYYVNDTYMQGFGFYGSGSTKVHHFYIGSYDTPWMSVTPEGVVTATAFSGALSGNASTATKLKTARTISLTGSVTGSGSFDGSGNLSIATTTNHTHSYLPLSGGTMTGTIITPGNDSVVIKPAKNNYDQIGASDCKFWKIYATTFYGNLSGNADTATTASAVAWANVTGKPTSFTPSSHASTSTTYGVGNGTNYGHVMLYPAADCTTYTSDSGGACTPAAVKKAVGLFANDYAPTKTGTGASGTWSINVTGSAGSVAWSNVSGKPSTFTPSSHTHSGYASIAAHNNLTASGNEFTFASSAFSGVMYVNYRTASGSLDGSISEYRFQNGAGKETAIRCTYVYGTAQAADYATSAGYAGYLPSYTEYSSTSSLDGFLTNGVLRWAKATAAALSFGNDGSVISVGWGGGYGSQVWLDDGSGPAKIAVRNRSGGSSWNGWRHCVMSCSETYYGSSLPSSGNVGDVFFKI